MVKREGPMIQAKSILFLALCLSSALLGSAVREINTSNRYKLNEYRNLFGKYGCELRATQVDLHEIDSDPISVVVHKASQMEDGVLVDDTSLDVEGADIGVKVRFLQHLLNTCVGKRACWRVLLAERKGDLVYVYQGSVDGTIVAPRGAGGYSFDPYLLPDGTDKTLAEERPEWLSARARAVESYLKEEPCAIIPVMEEWHGAWQDEPVLLLAG
jgi:XTP/dITP diphosphohydrolase